MKRQGFESLLQGSKSQNSLIEANSGKKRNMQEPVLCSQRVQMNKTRRDPMPSNTRIVCSACAAQ